MIGLVLVTHGGLADEFRAAVEHVVGAQTHMATISIGPDDNMEKRRQDIIDAISAVDDGAGVVLLTDMFGGTPTNLVLPFAGDDVEVVTGVNLPMLIKACQIRTRPLAEVARIVCEKGRESVQIAGEPI